MAVRQSQVVFLVVVLSTTGGAIVPTVAVPASAQTQLDSCTTVTEPGRYVLTADIENRQDRSTCLEIRSSDVVIDGNGHQLTTDRDTQTRRVGVTATAVDNVTIRNVSLSDWTVGIAFDGVATSQITGTQIENTQWGVEVENTTTTAIVQNAIRQEGNGIVVGPDGRNVSVERNHVNTTTFTGIVVRDATDSRISDNVVRGQAGSAGIGVSANGTIVQNNTVLTDGTAIGVTGSRARISDNTVQGFIGISVAGEENVLRGNTANRNELFGINVLTNGTTIRNNTASENGLAGIQLLGIGVPSVNNTIETNEVHGNQEYGIAVVGGDEGSQPSNLTARNNTVTGNGNAGIYFETVDGVRVSSNHVANNTDGIALNTSELNPFKTENVTVVGNRIVRNDETGVHVQQRVKAETVTVHRNTLAENGAFGLETEAAFVVDARLNYWGESTGPATPTGSPTSLRDPVTGTRADGNGDAISASADPLLENNSNVHFDPWLRQPPCSEDRERSVPAC